VLHERIGERFAQMLAAGFVEEVRGLRARPGLGASTPSMRAVGYRQVGAHLAGECSLDAAITAAVTATRQLAKRQLTWLRAEPGAHWFDPTDPKAPERLLATVAEWLQRRPKA
jgi:tRNA dimethylallyltransferase